MIEDKATITRLAVFGFFLGMVIGNGITMAFASSSDGIHIVAPNLADEFGEALAIVIQTIVSGLLGAVCFGGTIVFHSERLGLTLATFIHMVLAMSSVLVVGNILWWIDRSLEGNLFFALFMFMIYILIWSSVFISYKVEISKINKSLENRRGRKE